MALKACRECGKDVSTEAPSCPHCGVLSPAQAPQVSARKPGSRTYIKEAEYIALLICVAIIIGILFWPKNGNPDKNAFPVVSTPSANVQPAAADVPAPPLISIGKLLQSQTANTPLTIPTEQSGNYQAVCNEQIVQLGIPNQKSFYDQCFKQEKASYLRLVKVSRNYSGMPYAQKLLDSSIDQFTKNGSRDDSGVMLFFNQEISSFTDFRWFASSAGFNENDARRCIQQWNANATYLDWSVIDFCYRNSPDFRLPPAKKYTPAQNITP